VKSGVPGITADASEWSGPTGTVAILGSRSYGYASV